MKRMVVISKILLFLFVLCVFNSSSSAQGVIREFSSNLRLNDINPQAFRHFKKNYSSVSNEYWSKTDAGFVVKYTENQVISQVFYDQRGAFMYGIKYFEEKDLSKEIRSMVHKEFPEYQIDVVSEINSDANVIYLMSLKNKMTVKNIMISETGLRVIEDILYASR